MNSICLTTYKEIACLINFNPELQLSMPSCISEHPVLSQEKMNFISIETQQHLTNYLYFVIPLYA